MEERMNDNEYEPGNSLTEDNNGPGAADNPPEVTESEDTAKNNESVTPSEIIERETEPTGK